MKPETRNLSTRTGVSQRTRDMEYLGQTWAGNRPDNRLRGKVVNRESWGMGTLWGIVICKR
jgi:hypothetical protein